jgi:tyrosinase
MTKTNSGLTRRYFLKTTAAAAVGAAVLPLGAKAAPAAAKYTRYNVTSEGGKRALASYARGVEAMLKLPADNPQNWFHNAFIHLMDCPHGNWWFYVWHRGFIGNFEQSIRNLSGDPTFAIPYWDWTALPQIPDAMFDGMLNPADEAFAPYTRNLSTFTSSLQPALKAYWGSLTPGQQSQLNARGYTNFDLMWNDVTGYDPKAGNGVSGNMAYANTCGSRYLTRDNPKLDDKTAYDVSPFVILSGLLPTDFYNPVLTLSFNSSKTTSHNVQPGRNSFCTLEGMPHNKVHNYIGGVGPLDPGPYGSMTNFLSPVDPLFFLHHANMDRLWDMWTRKQQRLKLPYLPPEADLKTLSDEPFLFFVDGNGTYLTNGRAGEYLSTEKFDYNYEPGSGEEIVNPPAAALGQKRTRPLVRGVVKGNTATLAVPAEAVREHLAAAGGASLVAEVTLPHPSASSVEREFDVLVNAPAGVTEVGADSPYYAGTIAFFGKMMGMEGMAMDATFAVPLPKAPQAFRGLTAAANNTAVNIRIIPTQRRARRAPALKAVSVRAL